MAAISHLSELSERGDQRPAMIAADGRSITYDGLRSSVEHLAGQLRAAGVSTGDRVAIVMPNGPENATVFLAAASVATAAPLNPAYRRDEFRFYLEDLGASVVITAGPHDELDAALTGAVRRLVVRSDDGQPSLISETGELDALSPRFSAGDDVALVLHTSGTTARPKIVPLTHENLTRSATTIAQGLSLGPADRGLIVMPLFHIHGLVAGLLAPLAAGGSIVVPPGFDAFRFFHWLSTYQPTWFTAVPTMHQLILARAARQSEAAHSTLRFIRSSSASLPPEVLAKLEALFGVPVIEAYGMTEATHQMTSNPLPPLVRKPGAVGLPTGIELGIMDETSKLLGPGEVGEVVISGPTVTRGYLANPVANADAFRGRWFRTGDQGRLDSDGYLFLTGRLKELINRGGEKIAPREVGEVLLHHPQVEEAVAFAVPHPSLGEEVGAAVVPVPGSSPSAEDLKQHCAAVLAPFKVPARIVILDAIPKGATGKVRRIGLAKELGLE